MADYVASGVPFYRSKEIIELSKGNRITTELFIEPSKFEKIKKSFGSPSKGDILLTSVGTLGVPYIVDGDDFYFKDGNLTWMRSFSEKLSPKFLYYWLTSPTTQRKLEEISIGSTQKALTISALKTLEIPLPPRDTQNSIVEILNALSERITLLRETNTTLEAIAQALFKSWFVDFDPVRAKSEGKLPDGMDEATAALFPEAFEETELGMVPKGWRVLPFLDACDLQGGSQPPASVFIDKLQDGYVRLLQIRDFSSDAHTTYIPDTTKLKKVTEDDVLIGRYGSASGDKAKDSLGRVCRGLSGAYNVALMKLNPLLIGREYAFQLVSDPRFYNYLQGVSSKAVQSGFSKSELAQYKIALPNSALIERYEQIGVDFWLAIKTTNERIKTLKTLRDTLLPRLISGQLRIADAEAELDKVTA
jgi:type I restriction enzyme S subunit